MTEPTPEYTERQKLIYREAYYRTMYEAACMAVGIEPHQPPEEWQ